MMNYDVDELAGLGASDQVAVLSALPDHQLQKMSSTLSTAGDLTLSDGSRDSKILATRRSKLRGRIQGVRQAKRVGGSGCNGLGCAECGGRCAGRNLSGLSGPCSNVPAGPQRRACRAALQAGRAAGGGGGGGGQTQGQEIAALNQERGPLQARINAALTARPDLRGRAPAHLMKMQPAESPPGTITALRATVARLRGLDQWLSAQSGIAPAATSSYAPAYSAPTYTPAPMAPRNQIQAQRLENLRRAAELQEARRELIAANLSNAQAVASGGYAAPAQPEYSQDQVVEEMLQPDFQYEQYEQPLFVEEFGELAPGLAVDDYQSFDAFGGGSDDSYDDSDGWGGYDIAGLGGFSLKKILKKVAPVLAVAGPVIGTAFGGPVGTMIGGMVGQLAAGAAAGKPEEQQSSGGGVVASILPTGSPAASAAAAVVQAAQGGKGPCAHLTGAEKARCQLTMAQARVAAASGGGAAGGGNMGMMLAIGAVAFLVLSGRKR